MTKVALSGLTKTYAGAGRPALDDLTLDVASGALTAILGPSGCGKTTTMKLIAGLEVPSSGDIRFDGRSVLGVAPEHRGAVMVFQQPLLFPSMNVADNVGFGLRMRHRPRSEIADRVAEMLDLVRLPDLGARRVADLSGGQQQRVALARALIVRPRVLLLDEPLSSLDAALRVKMRDLIWSIQQRLAITTILVTHDQEDAVVMADSIALILEGRLRQVGAPDRFYKSPADAEVARFFGGRNLIRGVTTGTMFDGLLGRLTLPDGAMGGCGLLTFRPEAVRIGPGPVNTFSVTVTARTYLGTQTRLHLAIGDQVIEALVTPDLAEGMGIGDTLSINLPPHSLWIMPDRP